MSNEKVTIAIPRCPLDSFNNEHTGKTCSQITSDIKKACGGKMNNLGKTVHDTKCEVAKSAFNQGVKYATEQAKKQTIQVLTRVASCIGHILKTVNIILIYFILQAIKPPKYSLMR